jgi:hypothetical protein
MVEIVAKNDSEPYVRASALKVLSSMVKINLLWEHSLHLLDVKVSRFPDPSKLLDPLNPPPEIRR